MIKKAGFSTKENPAFLYDNLKLYTISALKPAINN